jgi:hypothetical protein
MARRGHRSAGPDRFAAPDRGTSSAGPFATAMRSRYTLKPSPAGSHSRVQILQIGAPQPNDRQAVTAVPNGGYLGIGPGPAFVAERDLLSG